MQVEYEKIDTVDEKVAYDEHDNQYEHACYFRKHGKVKKRIAPRQCCLKDNVIG